MVSHLPGNTGTDTYILVLTLILHEPPCPRRHDPSKDQTVLFPIDFTNSSAHLAATCTTLAVSFDKVSSPPGGVGCESVVETNQFYYNYAGAPSGVLGVVTRLGFDK